MSDTHAQTARAQADVQTGKPNIPAGHVEDGRPVARPGGRRRNPTAPWLAVGVLGLAIVIAVIFFAS